ASGGCPTGFGSPSRSAGGLGARAVSGRGAQGREASDVVRATDARARALWVDRRGGDVRGPPGRRGDSIRTWGADDPTRARVRVDARDRVGRRLHQPVPLRSFPAVHPGPDGPPPPSARPVDVAPTRPHRP